MKKKIISFVLGAVLLALCSNGEAQQSKVYRIGVLLPESAWYETVDGLRAGLRELGLEQGETIYSDNPRYEGQSKGGRGGGEKSRTSENGPDI